MKRAATDQQLRLGVHYFPASPACVITTVWFALNPERSKASLTHEPTRRAPPIHLAVNSQTSWKSLLPASLWANFCQFICTALISTNSFCSFCSLFHRLLCTEMHHISVTGEAETQRSSGSSILWAPQPRTVSAVESSMKSWFLTQNTQCPADLECMCTTVQKEAKRQGIWLQYFNKWWQSQGIQHMLWICSFPV